MYNYQTVDFIGCSFLVQDPLMNNIFDILSTTPMSREGGLRITDIDDKQLLNRIEQLAIGYKLRDYRKSNKELFCL